MRYFEGVNKRDKEQISSCFADVVELRDMCGPSRGKLRTASAALMRSHGVPAAQSNCSARPVPKLNCSALRSSCSAGAWPRTCGLSANETQRLRAFLQRLDAELREALSSRAEIVLASTQQAADSKQQLDARKAECEAAAACVAGLETRVAELETHVLQKSLCAELTEACPEAHVFRRQPDALDVEFANRAGVALEVYWVKDGAPADAKPDELTVALGDGQSSTHDSYPRHRWAFLRPDDPWEHAGRLDLPARPQEQRYVITANGGFDPEMQATIVDPSAVRPATWDDEEDGAWEPNTIPNPEFRTNQMYHVRLLEPDEELPAAGGGRREL